MSFSAFPFLLGFLPLLLIAFSLWPGKPTLIAASLIFYAAGATEWVPLLLVSIGGNFLLLRRMHASVHSRRWMLLGIVVNLGVLAWFKAAGTVPLGLSFFTFSQIGCLLHHGDGETPPPAVLDYALFSGFFPLLVAGPILNPKDLLQFDRVTWSFTARNVAVGSGFFIIGLLQKTLLADPLAAFVAVGFGDPAAQTLFAAWATACGYSLQLFFDFAGYTDMAIGLGLMFGVHLPDNFDRPYRAVSVIAYWQRWHMSLTRFLVANVHAPLTLSILRWRRTRRLGIDRKAQLRPFGFLSMIGLPVSATMMLVSVWHGFNATFLVFGGLHTGFLLINHAWRLSGPPRLPAIVSIALTYSCVLVASVFFRAGSVPDAVALLAGMAGLHGTGPVTPDLNAAIDVAWLGSLYAIVWFAPTARQLMQPALPSRWAWQPNRAWALGIGSAATVGLLAAGGTGEFLYVRF